MEWISTSEQLPELGQWVLARHNRGTWHDKDPNVICVVVKRVLDRCPIGNNLRFYRWSRFGPGSFHGQEIDWWMEIPSPPDPQLERIERETEAELLGIRICDKCLQRLPDAPTAKGDSMRKVYPFHCDSCGYGFSRTVVEKAAGEVECPCCGNKMLFTLVAAQHPKDGTNGLRPFAEDNQCPVCRGTKMDLRYLERYKHPHTLLEHAGREEVLKYVEVKCTTCGFVLPPMKCADAAPGKGNVPIEALRWDELNRKKPPLDLSNPEWDAAMSGVANKGITRTDQLKEKADKKQKLDEGERWAAVDRKNRELDERERRLAEREGGERDDGVPMCPVCGLEMLRKDSVGLCTNKTCPVASKRLIMTAMGYRVQMGKLEEGEKELAARTAEAEETIVLECSKCGLKSTDSRNSPGVHYFTASQKGVLCYSCYHEEKASREDSMKKSAGRKLEGGWRKRRRHSNVPRLRPGNAQEGLRRPLYDQGLPGHLKTANDDCNWLPRSGGGTRGA